MFSIAKFLANCGARKPALLFLEGNTILKNLSKMSGENINRCAVPTLRNEKAGVHERFKYQAKACKSCDVLYIGDSIVEALTSTKVYMQHAPSGKSALSFGIGGDRVEHVLFRISDGNWLEKLQPKIIVLFVGTNNTNCDARDICGGIEKIITTVHEKIPETRIILPLLLPKGQTPNPYRLIVQDVNKLLKNKYYEIGKNNVYIVDTQWEKFIDEEGIISNELLYDFLHLSEVGYEIAWIPVLEQVKKLLTIA